MSTGQSHLPPRCPFQRKPVPRNVKDPNAPHRPGYFPSHHKSSSQSQGSILEDQPAWLEDLLNDPEVNGKGETHPRSASDATALLDGDSLSGFHLGSTSSVEQDDVGSEGRQRVELDCVYGPNSPRGRSSGMTFPDSEILSALLLDGSLCISGISNNLKDDASIDVVNGEFNPEMMKSGKRHSGQRSRVRKLQYIAELEKTVNIFQVEIYPQQERVDHLLLALQAFESELAIRLASLIQHRAALTMENTKLKQQIARLRQKKLILEGRYQSLRKEAEMLTAGIGKSSSTRIRAISEASFAAKTGIHEATWQSLGIEKLNLN
ncbi:hypothetical protein SAY86_030013 [Trapa natans]|uniref:Uncharacterized protein n=1 Tax=Trapa natans TaxID=22666 RepID=A0AAN7RCF7_TRANT|nr:hypothetical protein SAY86_030013 [Trapa natans]